MKKTLTLLLSATIAVGGVAFAPAASAGCASYPGATVVKCVRDTPKKKRLSLVDRRVARVNLDVDHPVREPNLPKRTKRFTITPKENN